MIMFDRQIVIRKIDVMLICHKVVLTRIPFTLMIETLAAALMALVTSSLNLFEPLYLS